jgi:hypothetical protein
MSFIRRILAFWYDFIVGDDWLIAVGVVALLGLSAILAHSAYDGVAWLLMPVGTIVVLGASLWRAVRS